MSGIVPGPRDTGKVTLCLQKRGLWDVGCVLAGC